MAKYDDIYDRANTFATLAYNLGELIIKSGMKQAEVARVIGTRPQYMNAVIMGRRPFPIEWVLPVCKILNCSPNVLFGYERMFVPTDSDHASAIDWLSSDLTVVESEE